MVIVISVTPPREDGALPFLVYKPKGFLGPELFDVFRESTKKAACWYEGSVKQTRSKLEAFAHAVDVFTAAGFDVETTREADVALEDFARTRVARAEQAKANLRERPWTRTRIVVLDTETTGLEPCHDRVVEVGFCVMEDFELARGPKLFSVTDEKTSFFLNPGRDIPPETTAVHGITNEMVADALSFASAFDLLDAVIGQDPTTRVCAYNAGFDRAFFAAEFMRAFQPVHEMLAPREGVKLGHSWPRQPVEEALPFWLRQDYVWLDPLVAIRNSGEFPRGKGAHKLTTVAGRLGIDTGQAHRAGDDAATTVGVIQKAAHLLDALAGEDGTMDTLLMNQRVAAAKQEAEFWAYKAKGR